MAGILVAFALVLSPVGAVNLANNANPIRKVVSLMQNMQKEIEAEGVREKELYDKFMCFCSGNNGDLVKAAADGRAAIEEFGSKLKAEEAEKSSTSQELAGHKSDRTQATGDLEEATMLRGKENKEFEDLKADSETNINAMAGAIPALENGMGGASFMQTTGASKLKTFVETYPKMDSMDRRNVLSFLTQSGDYVPQSGQIVGILKAMKDEMEASLKQATSDEAAAVAGFGDLKASKEKEVEMATEAIETKTARAGELAVSVVQTKDALDDSTVELADTEKFMNQLESECASKSKEWDSRVAARNDEVAAISEAISILNDDDALDVFKKALPSALVQRDAVGFLQQKDAKASKLQKAEALLAVAASKNKSTQLSLLLFTVRSKLHSRAKGETESFGEVVKMIDDMVSLLGRHQKEDEKQRGWCTTEFDTSADEEHAAKTKLASVVATLDEQNDEVSTLMEEINTLNGEIQNLDKAVAEATEQRKEEHEDYINFIQMSEAALQLVEKAKNRMQKFYNPTLYKAAPKTERSMEQKIIDAGAFAQVSVHRVAPGEAPETFSGPVAKNSKSAGVIGLMDMILKELGNDMKDGENAEKNAQKDYSALMADSQETRKQDAKSLTDKEAAKAEVESKVITTHETRTQTVGDINLVASYTKDLHVSCDFIMQNFDLRKEARANEADSLKNAKAVLSGASFSL